MDCLSCGEKLGKSDIYCISCEAPVLTEDDVSTMLSTDSSKYIDIVTNAGSEQASDTMPFIEQEFSKKSGVMESGGSDSEVPDDVTMMYEHQNGDSLNGLSQNEKKPNSMTRIYRKAKSKTKAVERLKGISLKSFSRKDNTQEEDELSEPLPDKKQSRPVVIAGTIVACFALIGVGLFFLLRSPEMPDEHEPIDPEPVIAVSDARPERTEPVYEAVSHVKREVSAIDVSSNGHMLTTFHTLVDDVVLLRAHVFPEDIDAEVTWSSSDTEVLIVIPVDQIGFEAEIRGIAAGIVDIVLSVDDFEVRYEVYVDNYPIHLQLEDAVENTDTEIWLTITWIDGQRTGQEMLFERSGENQYWYMQEPLGVKSIDPVFGIEGNALTIRSPDDNKVFYFFAAGIGQYKNPDGTENEEFIWEFSTTRIEPEG